MRSGFDAGRACRNRDNDRVLPFDLGCDADDEAVVDEVGGPSDAAIEADVIPFEFRVYRKLFNRSSVFHGVGEPSSAESLYAEDVGQNLVDEKLAFSMGDVTDQHAVAPHDKGGGHASAGDE